MKRKLLTVGCLGIILVMPGIACAQGNYSLNMGSFGKSPLLGQSFLEAEAGMCAHGQLSSVDLELAEDAFKNVEEKTEDYIIGSVALPGYQESDDVHVYVDITGWIVAYYLSDEMPSKIIDWVGYKNSEPISSTRLSDAIDLVTLDMLVLPPDISYYDFRYPDATKMMIVVDEEFVDNTTETFRIKVPGDYSMYSRTWSHAVFDQGTSGTSGNINLDGVVLHNGSCGEGWCIWEGSITPTQLFPDIFHEISLYHNEYGDDFSYGAIMLIYAEPPL